MKFSTIYFNTWIKTYGILWFYIFIWFLFVCFFQTTYTKVQHLMRVIWRLLPNKANKFNTLFHSKYHFHSWLTHINVCNSLKSNEISRFCFWYGNSLLFLWLLPIVIRIMRLIGEKKWKKKMLVFWLFNNINQYGTWHFLHYLMNETK